MPHPRAPMLFLLALALCLLPAGLVRGEEDEEILETRFYDVHALTTGHTWFIRPVMGAPEPNAVSDEENPLFGAEGEENVLPLGTVDEIVELVKSQVEPVAWEITEGADIRALGWGTFVVMATPRIHQAVGAYLASMETAVLAPIAIDVRTLRAGASLPAEAAAAGRGAIGDEALEHLLAAAEPGPSLSLTALTGQTAVAYRGRQRSFVQDYDVSVAQEAKVSDPIVAVANLGITAQVRATLGNEPGTLALSIQSSIALHTGSRFHTTDENRTIELPTHDVCRVAEEMVVKPGAWYVADGRPAGDTNTRWLFLVRATPVPHEGRRLSPPVAFPLSRADAGPLVGRSFAVGDFDVAPQNYMGQEINLIPSNFTPPEPPELAEPSPIFPLEGTVDLIRELVAPRSWNRDGTTIEVRGGRLFVRNTERALATIESRLNALRRLFMTAVVCEIEAYDMPVELAWQLRKPGADGAGAVFLSSDRLRGLEDVKLLERVQVQSLAGARNNVTVGDEFTYAQDFETQIAQGAVIANPVVLAGFSGVVADVQPADTSTRDAVNVCVRFTRSRLVGSMRQVETPHGPVDQPEMELLRLRTNVLAPFDRTTIVGAGGDGERETLVLITPRRVPFGR